MRTVSQPYEIIAIFSGENDYNRLDSYDSNYITLLEQANIIKNQRDKEKQQLIAAKNKKNLELQKANERAEEIALLNKLKQKYEG